MRLAVQRTGVVLTGAGTVSNYAVSRLLGTGAIDGDFASSGTITPYDSPMSARALAVGADDEIFLAGYRYDNPSGQTWLAIQRYSPAGSFITEIDLSQAALSVGGAVGAYPRGLDIATLPDGRLLVAGTSDSYCTGSWFVAKFDAAGRLDPTFGKGGAYVGSAGCAYRLVPTADNGLLVLGSTSDTIDANFLVKLNASGQPDGAFGVGGVVNGAFSRTAPRLQANGRIILGGDNFSLLRLLGNGALDPTFGTNGVLANQTGMALRLEDFLLMPDGSILLVGATAAVTGAPGDPSVLTLQPMVTRYAANGSLDRSFGDLGILKISGLTHSQPSGSWGPAETMALMSLPNGKALLATANASSGWFNRANVVYRFVVDASATGSGNKNYQGLWWAAPAGSESGWGLSIAHQGDTIFATWFTYGASGRSTWQTMTAHATETNTYSGTLYVTAGPPFNVTPFDPTKIQMGEWGTGTLNFSDGGSGTFSIVAPCPFGCPTFRMTKAITRQQFGALPTCVFGAQPDLSLASNYTDIWWAAPPGSESGWGIFLTHQGDTIFAAWYTYDLDGLPMWLVATATKSGPGEYDGVLYRTTGPPFSTVPFDPAAVVATPVGSLVLSFADGNHATFSYSVTPYGVMQSKPITREILVPPGTACN